MAGRAETPSASSRNALVRDACAALGRSDKAARFLAYLDEELIQDLRTLTTTLWTELKLPIGLKAELQHRLLHLANEPSSSGSCGDSDSSGPPVAAREDRLQLSRWTRLLLALTAASQLKTTADNMQRYPEQQGRICAALALVVARPSPKCVAEAYTTIHGEGGLSHLRRSLRDLIVWRCCEEVGFNDREKVINAFESVFSDHPAYLKSRLLKSYQCLTQGWASSDAFASNNALGVKRSHQARKNNYRSRSSQETTRLAEVEMVCDQTGDSAVETDDSSWLLLPSAECAAVVSALTTPTYVRISEQRLAVVKTRNTFVDVSWEKASSCGYKSCPPHVAAAAMAANAVWSESISDAMSTLADGACIQDLALDDCDKLPLSQPLCQLCNFEDPNGWGWRKDFWCRRCWLQWYSGELLQRSSTTILHEHLDPAVVEDPIETPSIDIEVLHFLDRAQRSSAGACLVLLGYQRFLDPAWARSLCDEEHATDMSLMQSKGTLYELFRTTNFERRAPLEFWPAPRWGGIYVPAVKFRHDKLCQDVDPYHRAVIYACCPWCDDDQVEQFEDELRVKLTNLLRACHKHGHREVILASRFTALPLERVARILREILLTGDMSHAFRSVHVALQPVTLQPGREEQLREKFRVEFRDWGSVTCSI